MSELTMLPFDVLFMELAGKEVRVVRSFDASDLPHGTFLFRELFCSKPQCDCRRVILHVHWVEQKTTVASINYAFEPPSPPYEDEGQMFLDPLNPQSGLSETFFDLFQDMIATDRAYHDRLVRHYDMWKAVVDDPKSPHQARLKKVKRHGRH